MKLPWLCFAALLLFYVAFAPATGAPMGYAVENLAAADRLAGNLGKLVTGRPLEPFLWTRHGAIEPIVELPFAVLSRTLFGPSAVWLGRVMVLLPILETALLGALIFLWTRRLTGSATWACALTLAAGVSTMLWPYAYIGLETTQSLALLGAAYLVLARPPTGRWAETLLLAVACAIAVSVKLNGPLLGPAVVFLVARYLATTPRRERAARIALMAVVIGVVYVLNYWARQQFWEVVPGREFGFALHLIGEGPVTAGLHALSLLGAPNKGLLVYAPIVALGLLAAPLAYRNSPAVATLALLTLAGLVAGVSPLWAWADETWGPRYLHAAIAPLVVCIAAARASTPFRWRREVPLLAAVLLGTAVSSLGMLFYYGQVHFAARDSSHSTLEALQHDLRWNHPRFNLELLRAWARPAVARTWPPAPRWWFVRPADAPPHKTVDLRAYAVPQPVLFQAWRRDSTMSRGVFQLVRAMNLACFLAGLALAIHAWRLARRLDGPAG